MSSINNNANHNNEPLLTTIQSLPKEIRNLLAGGIAGMFAKSFVAPIDRIKILYQVTSAQFRLRDVPKVAYSIIEKEGAAALWKGNTATMIRVFPYSGIQFMIFDYCKVYFLGGGSGANNANFIGRDDRSDYGENDSSSETSNNISRTMGNARISHRGTIALPSSGVTHANNTDNNATITSDKKKKAGLTPIESLVSGMIAGTISVLCTYPLDLARAQLAVLRKKKEPTPSVSAGSVGTLASSSSPLSTTTSSNLDKQLGIGRSKSSKKGIGYVLSHTFQQNGPRGLYRGITPTILGILPYSGIAFTINEQAKRQIIHICQRDPTTIERLQCGALSGLFAQTLAYPLEVTRRRMQTIGIVPTSGSESAVVNFMGVSKVKPQVDELPVGETQPQSSQQKKKPQNQRMYAPSTATAASTTSTAQQKPIIQHQHHKPPSMITTMQHLLEEQGIRGFYKGVTMNWVKGPIAFSISFTTFDTIQGWIETEEERLMKKRGAASGGAGRGDREERTNVQLVRMMTKRRLTNNDDD